MVSLLFINKSPAAMVIHTSGGTPPFNAGCQSGSPVPQMDIQCCRPKYDIALILAYGFNQLITD